MSLTASTGDPIADTSAFRKALSIVRSRAGAPIAFGGPTRDGALVLEQVLGNRTRSLHGLRVLPGRGLGGQVVQTERPFSVEDYEPATTITHDYDNAVLGEGIRGVTGVPVVVGGSVRGVLYAATRLAGPLGGTATATMIDVARALARELVIRDEVNRRLDLIVTGRSAAAPSYEGLDELHAELCGIAAELDEPELRRRVQAAAGRLAALGVGGTAIGRPAGPVPVLSPREVDVLAEVELGCTNAEAAARLSLLPETVKAYLRSASRKLGVHGRYQAVLAARRLGLLAER